MNAMKYLATGICAAAFLACSALLGPAQAADLKIGVVNMQKVLATSNSGKKAQAIIEQKVKSYDTTFKKEKDSLISLRDEIEKKGSTWSDSVKQQKISDFQKKNSALGNKEREANQEIRKLQEQHMKPVLETLEEVIQNVAKSGKYDLVIPSNTILFASGKYDITDQVTKALDAAMKK